MQTENQNDGFSPVLLALGCSAIVVAVAAIVWACSSLTGMRDFHNNQSDVTNKQQLTGKPVVQIPPLPQKPI